MNQLRVVLLSKEHANAVAELHETAFRNFFLTSLGTGFLRAFYESIIISKEGIAIGIFEETKLLGFSIGTTQSKGFYKKLILQNFFRLIPPLLMQVLKKPAICLRMMSSLKSSSNYEKSSEHPVAILLSICVATGGQNKGIGSKVLAEFEKFCKTNNLSYVTLSTDADNNDSVNSFYQKNEYKLTGTFCQGERRKMNLYIKEII